MAGDQAIVERSLSLVAGGTEASKPLLAHQAQLLLAAGNPDTEAAPQWRRVNG